MGQLRPFLVGVGVGVVSLLGFLQLKETPLVKGSTQRENLTSNTYTNPLLECEVADENTFVELKSFRSDLESLVNKLTKDLKASNISVYFRDLNNGPWFGINPNEKFYPASLMKVPILVGTLKLAEERAGLLDEQIDFGGYTESVTATIKPTLESVAGKYTIKELLRRMIVNSDNGATEALVNQLGVENLLKPQEELRVPTSSVEKDGLYTLSVKNYASFFRILYNASYLSHENSEFALSLLAQSDFKDGLVAGVPGNVKVAHKFGEREFEGSTEVQFHDCGIVYYPKKPYLICVMSQGRDIENLKRSVSEISKLVYSEIDSQFR